MKKCLLFAGLLAYGNIDAITWEEALIAAYNNNNSWFAEQIDKEIAEDSYTQAVMTFLPPPRKLLIRQKRKKSLWVFRALTAQMNKWNIWLWLGLQCRKNIKLPPKFYGQGEKYLLNFRSYYGNIKNL